MNVRASVAVSCTWMATISTSRSRYRSATRARAGAELRAAAAAGVATGRAGGHDLQHRLGLVPGPDRGRARRRLLVLRAAGDVAAGLGALLALRGRRQSLPESAHGAALHAAVSPSAPALGRLRLALWALAAGLGGLEAFAGRHVVSPGGLAHLD